MAMRDIVFVAKMFSAGIGVPVAEADRDRSRTALLLMLHTLTGLNKLWLGQYPDTRSVYDGGVRYIGESHKPMEHWYDIKSILELGGADCKSLCAARCAELQKANVKARPFIKWRQMEDGRWMYHCVVWRPKGTLTVKPPPLVKTPTGLALYPSAVRGDTGLIEDPSRLLGMGWEEGFEGTNGQPKTMEFMKRVLAWSNC